MKKLKTILQSKVLYIVLIIFTLLYIFLFTIIFMYDSVYNPNDTVFKGKIIKYKIDGNLLNITLKTNKEKIICNYYINTIEEKETLEKEIKYGITIEIKGTLTRPSKNTIPNTFNYKKYLYNHKIYYLLKANEVKIIKSENILNKIRNKFISHIKGIDIKGYINALVIGNKDDVSYEINNMYKENGVSHLFSISGMHIGLFSLIFSTILEKICKSKNISLVILNIILLLYGFITGYPSSIKRALSLTIFISINKIFKLNISTLKILILSLFVLILYNPFIIYDIGFQYSSITTFGIILNKDKIRGNKIKQIFTISFIASLYSLPISLYYFKTFNILSIINNIIYVPIISYLIYPLCLITTIFPFINKILYFSIIILEKLTIISNKYLVINLVIPINELFILIYYIILLLANFKNRLLLLILIYLTILYLKPSFDSNYHIYYFDVGQGDSTLIVTPHHKEVILIDTGGKVNFQEDEWKKRQSSTITDNIIIFLHSLGINKINYLVLSHGDYDHMGEAINLVNNFKVEKVVFNIGKFNHLETKLIKVLENKNIKYYQNLKELNITDNKLYFFNTREYENENDNSNVLYFKLNNYKFLFMGDAGIEKEKDLLEKYNLNDIDFIKTGHHGSDTSSSKEFISSIKPKNCLISVGKNNRYGHPKEEILDTLNDYCNIYRTDQDGSIEIKINKSGYKTTTYSP